MPIATGRFAPSPTGHLHLGSLIGAVASYLDIKACRGKWLVRIEDLDPPREVAGAADSILQCLHAHGLHWDADILWQGQKQRQDAYASAIDKLFADGNAYYCTCTRTDVELNHGVYSGHCRGQTSKPSQDYSIRAKLPNTTISFIDAIQGHYQQQLQNDGGDIIVQRKDKLYAYQLAVVVDDAYQGITHVLRGSDLLDSTPRQIALQQLLNLPTPSYAHFPVITNIDGHKFSKQTFADAVDEHSATDNLLKVLTFLKQPLPPISMQKNTQSILAWATAHWKRELIPHCLKIIEPQH